MVLPWSFSCQTRGAPLSERSAVNAASARRPRLPGYPFKQPLQSKFLHQLSDGCGSHRYSGYAHPLREFLPTDEKSVPDFFQERPALFERLRDHADPVCPSLPALSADASQVIDPVTGAKLGGEMAS